MGNSWFLFDEVKASSKIEKKPVRLGSWEILPIKRLGLGQNYWTRFVNH